jgi:phospholipase C
LTALDNYHCSVLGPTWPNRLYHLSADIDPAGTNGGPIISNIDPVAYTWKTYRCHHPVVAIGTASHHIVATMATGLLPGSVAVVPDGSQVWSGTWSPAASP